MESILPSGKEVERWIREVVVHSNHVEYYLNQLGIGKDDPQRPHDMVGRANKFEWKVVCGLALAYREENREDKEFFNSHILPSIEYHRNQYHHQMWNKYNPNATEEDLMVGAVDSVCALLENRVYHGGRKQEKLGAQHDWDGIEELLLEKNPKYKVDAAKKVIPKIMNLPKPNLWGIEDVFDFGNIGIRSDVYDKMKARIDEGVSELRKYVDIF